jgi:hypothetical protein
MTPAFLAQLIGAIASTMPARAGGNEADLAADLDLARTMLGSFRPENALEAAVAAQAIAMHFAVMDSFARAAEPGTRDEMVLRWHASAIACAREFDKLLRYLGKRQPAPAMPRPSAPARTTNDPIGRVYHRAELPPITPEMSRKRRG